MERYIRDAFERLLDYDLRRFWFENGWSVRCRIWRAGVTQQRPHGFRYSFTLHDETALRVLGFDNKHHAGDRAEFDDHEHRYSDVENRRRYDFVDPEALLADFFTAVNRACDEAGITYEFIDQDEISPNLARYAERTED